MGKSFWIAKTKTEKETQAAKNITAWSQPPFFSLLLTCIKCQEEQKPLLTSLFNQLNDFITVCCYKRKKLTVKLVFSSNLTKINEQYYKMDDTTLQS